MRKGRWLAGGLVTLAALTLWLPDLRLARELAAARQEGLWTTPNDVRRAAGTAPEADTALTLIRDARGAERGRTFATGAEAIAKTAAGTATPAERELARTALKGVEASTSLWVQASRRSMLVSDRNYEDGFGTLYPEFAPIHGAVDRLIAAARLGLSPKENLLAAARLSAFVRQEPGEIAAAVGTNSGMQTLKAAQAMGFAKEVDAALGPPVDARRILGPELPAFLTSADYRPYMAGLSDLGLRGDIPWTEGVIHYGSLARNTKAAGVARWRDLWARLPKDGQDFDGAAKAVDEEFPKLDPLMSSYADVMAKLLARAGDPGRGGFLRAVGEFERERAKSRVPQAPERP